MNSFTFILQSGRRVKLEFDPVAIDKIECYFDCPLMNLPSKPEQYFRMRSIVEIIFVAQSGTEYTREEILAGFPLQRIGEFFLGLFTVLANVYDVKNLPEEIQKM
jgi:hypothetical protein